MALVTIQNIHVLDNPSYFTNPFQFEIIFECLQELEDDLEWKAVYVGSAEDESRDQILEEVMVGPVQVGTNRFILQCPAPDPKLIANEDLIGVTVLLITCSYLDSKFVQIGYYVNNEYAEPFDPEQYPNPVDISKLYRNLLADQPRVTRYPINWASVNEPNQALDELAVEEKEQFSDNDDEVIKMNDDMMAEGEENDEEEDEEDENEDIDIENEEESEGEGEEDEGDLEGEEGEGEEVEGEEYYSDEYAPVYEGMVVVEDEGNTMDVDRMLQ